MKKLLFLNLIAVFGFATFSIQSVTRSSNASMLDILASLAASISHDSYLAKNSRYTLENSYDNKEKNVIAYYHCNTCNCPHYYSNKANMLLHRELKHAICATCDKHCIDLETLQNHIDDHHSHRRIRYVVHCPKCNCLIQKHNNQGGSLKHALDSHMRKVHTR